MNPTQDTLDLVKTARETPSDAIAKSISTNTGLLAFDLQAPAKNLYPFVTPLRNSIPRVGGGTGTATNWRQVSAINGSGYDAMGWVPEGQRSAQMSYVTATKSATFVTIGEEDGATYEAINAGRGFEDIQARMTFRLLQKMMLKEEMAILGGNASMQLGTPGTPTLSASGSGATLPATTYYVKVAALTLEGWQNSSLTNGVATTKPITGADGHSYTLSGGSSNISAESSSQSVSAGNTLFATVTALQGAVAYGWFVGTASGAETLQAITTINSAAFSAPLTAGAQPATAVTADNSANPSYAYDGLLTSALKSGSGAYVKTMATGTAGTGTPLTASGRGSVVEIDTMFQTMWNNFELSPTVLYVNSQELGNLTTKVLNGSSSPLLRYNEPGDGDAFNITASGTIGWYYNPYNTANGTQTGLRIPIRLHPRVPPGTIVGWAEQLPIQYQSSEVPNVAEVKTRQDYYEIDWPIVTRQRQVGVYAEEVLAVYAPFAMGVINNIGNG
ncbi:MAG TPA: hypothetical protein VHW66_19030 [Stellaceae bacterium]|jgi:hypothetical protein|nr:hypothetical protein [Stellaceae bacterium]